jgi:hypothetical protein
MSIDDYFGKFDGKMGAIANTQTKAQEVKSKNEKFLEEFISRLAPMVSTYKAKLKERGVNADVESHPTGISFTLKYKDGGHRATHIGRDSKTSRIEITTFFTDDNHKNYRSTDGNSHDQNSWQDEFFELSLQRCIDDYLFYADRHGGINS